MGFFLGISRAIDWFTTLIGRVMFWLSLVMVLLGAFNVLTRYVGRELNMSLGGTRYIALQTYAYDLIFLLGAAYVLNKNAHVRVDILYSTYSERTKAWVDIIFTFLFLIPFCVMGLYFSWGYVLSSWGRNELNYNAGGLPVYPIKTVILLAFALLILQGISEVIKKAAFLRSGQDGAQEGNITEKTEAL